MRSRVITAGLAASLSLALTACSSDDPDASPEAPAQSSQSATADATESSAEAEETATGVPPATGEQLGLRHSLTLRLPEGDWQHSDDGASSFSARTPVKDGYFEIVVAEIETTNTGLDPMAKASLATRRQQARLTPGRFGSVPTRSPNIVVNGLEGWVLEGADKQTTFFEFGTFHAGVTAFVTFLYPTSHQAGPEWVESVLASVEWR